MTVLRKETLRKRLRTTNPKKRLVVTPLLDPAEQIGPASIDLRLGTDFLIPRRNLHAGIDPGDDRVAGEVGMSQERVVVPFGENLWLHAQQLVLGATLEFVKLPPDCAAYVLSRSSWGRVGLLVATAITVQPGFGGNLTLELVNEGNTPIKLWPGLRIAQLVVHSLDRTTAFPYAEKFVRAIGPATSKLGWEKNEVQRLSSLGTTLGAETTVGAGIPGEQLATPAMEQLANDIDHLKGRLCQ
jgi:dCTP deaminase